MKYKCLTRVKTGDGTVHEVGAVVELTETEAQNCLSFRAVEPVLDEQPQPAPEPEPQGDAE